MATPSRRRISTQIVPLTTANMTQIAFTPDPAMLWHLHVNNTSINPVTVEIHKGDTDLPSIQTLLISLAISGVGSEGTPVVLSEISLEANTRLFAKASVANVANVFINVSEPGNLGNN